MGQCLSQKPKRRVEKIYASVVPQFDRFPAELIDEVSAIKVLCDREERLLQARDRLARLESLTDFEFRELLSSDETLRRLRWKTDRLDEFAALLDSTERHEGKGEILPDGKRLWTKLEPDGSALIRLQGKLNIPLTHVAALINEVDLQPGFIPWLRKAEKLHKVTGCGDFSQAICRMHYALPPPLSPRECDLFCFGCDALDSEPFRGFVVLCVSPPEGSTDWWGYPLPQSHSSVIQMQMRSLAFVIRPCNDGSEVTLVMNADFKLRLPQRLLNWLSLKTMRYAFEGMDRLSRRFELTPYPARMSADERFYKHFIKEMILWRFQADLSPSLSFVSCRDHS